MGQNVAVPLCTVRLEGGTGAQGAHKGRVPSTCRDQMRAWARRRRGDELRGADIAIAARGPLRHSYACPQEVSCRR